MASRGVLLLTFLAFYMCCSVTQGRYLPTRSDKTRKEQIKEIIRILLDLNNDGDQEYNRQQIKYDYRLHLPSIKRAIPESFIRK
ncbi:uncharacterized protein LOC143246226 [Tachypleus tridentatus]|uniref:uncharacterized protein LOC143246226 n=1 Tax=Tachypleus tridentatus TaxID=6853 RepID=UPI003FCF7E1B